MKTTKTVETYSCDWCGKEDITPVRDIEFVHSMFGNDVVHTQCVSLTGKVAYTRPDTGNHFCKECAIKCLKTAIKELEK